MGDLSLYRRNDGNFDLDFDAESGDLRLSESLENAVAISIGTFARERSAGNGASIGPKIGGFWGDALDESGTLGGYLYEAFPGKREEASLRDLESSVSQSLKWMLDDGVAKASIVHGEIFRWKQCGTFRHGGKAGRHLGILQV